MKKLLLLLIPALGLFLCIWENEGYYRLSNLVFDLFQKSSIPKEAKHIVLIKIDQYSLNKLEEEKVVFPIPRSYHGSILSVLKEAGAKGVAFDLLFTERSFLKAEDVKFKTSIIKHNIPVYLPGASSKETIKDTIKILKDVSRGHGTVEIIPDMDGVVRRAPTNFFFNGKVIKSFSEGIASDHGVKKRELERIDQFQFYPLRSVPQVSYFDVLTGNFKKEIFKEKIAFVAYTAPGLFDLKPTPVERQAPGVLIHISALENRLEGNRITEITKYHGIYLFALLFILQLLIFKYLNRPLRSVFSIIFSISVPLIISFLLWKLSIWFNFIPASVATAFSGLGLMTYNFHTHWKDRLKFSRALSYSMSPEMVELIRSGKVDIDRFGEEKEIVILFCDLEGFTTLSELKTPHEIVRILNSYLDQSVSIILTHSGYVDKFIGDAIMAIWGAPIDIKNKSNAAIEAGIDIRKRLNSGEFPFKVRIGIHIGQAIVGNIGSSKRYNYTAIGDTVNLASRLEGLGKVYGLEMLLSGQLIEDAQFEDSSQILEIDHVRVKGKSEPIRVFTYLTDSELQYRSSYLRGLQYYYLGNFQDACEAFSQIIIFTPAKIMNQRAEVLMAEGSRCYQGGIWSYDEK